MIAAVLALSIVAAAPDATDVELGSRGRSPFTFGMDAADILPSLRTPPRPPPELLAAAPTSETVAVFASAATTGTGFLLSTGLLLVTVSSIGFPWVVTLVGLSVGFLMMNFGPNVGDLINGDAGRFVRNGLLRLGALIVLAPLGVFSPLVWMGWMAADIAESRNAPARWLLRNGYLEDPAKVSARNGLVPESGRGNLLRLRF